MRHAELAPWRRLGPARWEEEERPIEALNREMEAFQRNLNRLFAGVFGEGRPIVLPEFWATGGVTPRLDETEDEAAYHVDIELPGIDAKDVEVTLSNGLLTVRGEKKAAPAEEAGRLRHSERSYGVFRRTLAVPGEVDEKRIRAEFRNGVLTIDLPKTRAAQPKVKHIPVKGG